MVRLAGEAVRLLLLWYYLLFTTTIVCMVECVPCSRLLPPPLFPTFKVWVPTGVSQPVRSPLQVDAHRISRCNTKQRPPSSAMRFNEPQPGMDMPAFVVDEAHRAQYDNLGRLPTIPT